MTVEVIVRQARPSDRAARDEIVRRSLEAHFWDAFWLFLFQEIVGECCVLFGAVLFIFVGTSVSVCVLVPPVAAAMTVAAIVYMTHMALADKHVQEMRHELVGLVAEMKGGIVMEPARVSVSVRSALGECSDTKEAPYTRIVGTASISSHNSDFGAAWLHGVAVHPCWRRRGIGRTLIASTRLLCASRGVFAVHCVLSQLQPAARTLLHANGWECTGAYSRPLCAGAVSLLLAHLSLNLPHA